MVGRSNLPGALNLSRGGYRWLASTATVSGPKSGVDWTPSELLLLSDRQGWSGHQSFLVVFVQPLAAGGLANAASEG